MIKIENAIEEKEIIGKLLSGELIDFVDKDYTLALEKTRLYKAIVYKNKNTNEIVKKIIDINVDESSPKINDNYLLPIGSVVCVLDTDYMVTARFMQDEIEYSDYTAVKFPIGLIDDEIYRFNQANIDCIKFVGYENEENASLSLAIKKQMDSRGTNG